jgi:Holliday junction resolvase RusA-like endonuclease
MFVVVFSVNTQPVGKGRPRFSKVGGFVKTYTDQKTRDYEAHISQAARTAMGESDPIEGSIRLSLVFRLPTPRSTPKKRLASLLDGSVRPLKRPDLDNLGKSVLDGMNGIVYRDDAQVVTMCSKKIYSEIPGVDICVMEEK